MSETNTPDADPHFHGPENQPEIALTPDQMLERVAIGVEAQRADLREKGLEPKDFMFGVTDEGVVFSVDEVPDPDIPDKRNMIVRYGRAEDVDADGGGMIIESFEAGSYFRQKNGSLAFGLKAGALFFPSARDLRSGKKHVQWGVERNGKQTFHNLNRMRLRNYLPEAELTEQESQYEADQASSAIHRLLHDRFGDTRVFGEDKKPVETGVTHDLAVNYDQTKFSVQEHADPSLEKPFYTASGLAPGPDKFAAWYQWRVDQNTGTVSVSTHDPATGQPTPWKQMSRKEVEHFKDQLVTNFERAVHAGKDEAVTAPPQPIRAKAKGALGKIGLGRGQKES